MKAETAAMIMMSGSADLEDITITKNGEYESVDHDGFDVVTVEVETYWDEYQQALQQISDLEDALEDCHDCRDAVVAAIQVYDPTYDPAPTDCPADEIPALVQAVQPTLGAKFITANGTYLPASDNLDGYNQVVVDVPTWESCIQTIAAKLGLSEPYDCKDITDAIDEQRGVDVPTGVDPAPIAFELEADSVASTEIDGKKVTVAFAGRGYRYVEPPNYTPADIDDPIYEYLSGNLYTAFVEQPEQQISPGYGTYMYSITVDGVGTYYGLSISDPHKTTSLAYVSEIAFSNSDLLVKNSNGANMCVFNAAQGKSWSGTSTVKII